LERKSRIEKRPKVADKTPAQIIKHLSDAAEQWTNRSILHDDMTLLVMKVK
jgi:serine phosphatase RsbU (regulator of sigma subunit)